MFNKTNEPIKNELQEIFNYKGKQVRSVILNGKPGLVAKDVCETLDITWNGSKTLANIKDNHKGVINLTTPGGDQELLCVDEPGLYKLVFRSNKEEAEQFQDWVYEEVLPSIRKTGKYETPDFLDKLHESMGKIRSLGWRAAPSVRKQHVNENLAKLRDYYHGLIDQDVVSEPNPMSIFVQEYCIINQDSQIDRSYLYDGYVRWCVKNNVYPKSKTKLAEYLDEMDEVAYLRVDRKSGLNARFMGIELNDAGLKHFNNM